MTEPLIRLSPNGARLVAWQHPGASRAALLVAVAAGSHDEPPAWPGLAHFLEHLLFLGGERFSDEQRLMPFVQGNGGQVNASTGARQTRFFCEVPAGHLEEAGERLMDMLVRPRLSQEDQRAEREILEAEYHARAGDAEQQAQSALLAALAPAHPASAFVAGHRDSLAVDAPAFQAALRQYHRDHYRASRMTLVLVGPQAVEALLALGVRLAEPCRAGAGPSRPLPPPFLGEPPAWLRWGAPGQAATWVGFRLHGEESAFDAALTLLDEQLGCRLPGSLFAQLAQAGWVNDLHLQTLYRYRGQAVLALRCETLGEPAPADLRQAVLDWLSGFAARLPSAMLAETLPPLSTRSPLACAQHWLERVANVPEPQRRECLMRALQTVSTSDCTILQPTPGLVVEPTLACGFPLALHAVARLPDARQRLVFQGPPANPLVDAPPARREAALPAAVVCQPWGGEEVAVVLRWQAAPSGPIADARRLRLLVAAAQALGLRFDSERPDGTAQWLCLGEAERLPGLLAAAIDCLAPANEALARPAPAASMPVRRLLQALDERLAARLQARQPPGPHWQAQLVGGDDRWKRRMAAVLAGLPGKAVPVVPVPPSWEGEATFRQPCEGQDHARVMFYPVPDASPEAEASYRVLAQSYQPAFYRFVRTDRQLGYGVFCAFHLRHGQPGLLFAVQSSVADPEAIRTHVRAFLQARPPVAESMVEQAQALEARLSTELGRLPVYAESAWQAVLGGRPAGHPQAVVQALRHLSPTYLDALQSALQTCAAGCLEIASCR